ncbi:hypothetical protein H78_02233 [Pseudomonas protegens]|uniref:hypothetical protein n=1 Tax=Pseudomonas protegens TaxID=380021 RepID=UPI0009C3568E|nr:hypothetical protein [Pseudomonas protegens]AQT08907.1 hypothetical protein H78_02233 [Pseudomonas protegens]
MITGIFLKDCVDVQLNDISMIGMDKAFEVYNSEDIRMRNVELKATRVAVAGAGNRGIKVERMHHSEAGWAPTPSRLALAIQGVIYAHV